MADQEIHPYKAPIGLGSKSAKVNLIQYAIYILQKVIRISYKYLTAQQQAVKIASYICTIRIMIQRPVKKNTHCFASVVHLFA